MAFTDFSDDELTEYDFRTITAQIKDHTEDRCKLAYERGKKDGYDEGYEKGVEDGREESENE